jgi:Ser/Thr protein kinase RdoA (MazF antagonist)
MDDAGGGERGLRPDLTPALAAVIEATWGFGLDSARPLGGSTGLNLLVKSALGPVVVRAHRAHVTSDRVEAMQLAREGAASAGVPTASLMSGRNGERHVSVGSTVVEVERFVQSDGKMDTIERITQAMPMLARLHDALGSLDLPDAANDARFANYIRAGQVVTMTGKGTKRMRHLDVSLHRMADVADQLARELSEAERGLKPLEGQWCHGDYWHNNVLFRGGELVLVADFGFMNRRPRVDDLALTLYFTLWELDSSGVNNPADVLARLLDAYDRAAQQQLSDPEREALPLALARQPLWSIGVWAAQLDDPEEVRAHLHGHENALRLAERVLIDLDRWREAFRVDSHCARRTSRPSPSHRCR